MSKSALPQTPASRTDDAQVSVVMPVHNALPHLDQAVESILNQTFRDFEFVILDDGSTDGSTERLRHWASRDPRIRLIEVEENLGPALSAERVARAASASIVVRMDADDISYATRVEEQLRVLKDHPDVGVVGGLYDIIDLKGRRIRRAEPWRLVHRSVFPPFGNGPMTYRREVFDSVGGYRKESEFWEDQDLLIRMASVTRLVVIPHAVYQVRQSQTSTRIASEQARVERALDLMYRSRDRLEQSRPYDDLLGESPSETAKLDPRVFIALGSVILWSGGRPRLFRRLLRRGDLAPNFKTASALAWTAWASASPWSLRIFLRLLLVSRNLYASATIGDQPVNWSPPVRNPVVQAEQQGTT